ALATNYRVDVDTSVTDQAHNPAEVFTSRFSTVADLTSANPRVLAVAPIDGALDVPGDTHVGGRLSQPLDPATIHTTSLQVFNDLIFSPLSGTVSLDATHTVATFVLSGTLPALSFFDVEVTADARDASGNPADGFFSSFETGFARDDVAPALLGTSPASGA